MPEPSGREPSQFPTDETDNVLAASSDLATWTSIAQCAAGGPMTDLGGAGTVTETPMRSRILGVSVQDGQLSNVVGSRLLRPRVIAP